MAPTERLPPEGVTIRASAGYNWQWLLGIPSHGFDAAVALGGETDAVAGYGGAEVWVGSTQDGLGLRQVRLFGGFEVIIGRVRLGPEVSLAYLDVDRVTTPTDDFQVISAGIAAKATVDIVRFDPRGAIFVQGRMGIDAIPGNGGDTAAFHSSWGPTVSAGFRY